MNSAPLFPTGLTLILSYAYTPLTLILSLTTWYLSPCYDASRRPSLGAASQSWNYFSDSRILNQMNSIVYKLPSL
jgi:hypothetical protein